MTLALLITAVTGAWADEQSETFTTTAKIVEGTHFTISNNNDFADGDGMGALNGITVTPKNGEFITKVVITCGYGSVSDANTSVSSGTKEITNGGGTITVTGVNATTFTFTCTIDIQFKQFVVYYGDAPAAEPAIKVTTNKAENETTFTTASFEMPAYDATAEYELVRDMSVDMPVTVQDAEQNSRFRVKKQDDTFVPVGLTAEQIVALFTVYDDIEEKKLTANTDFTVQLFAVNEEGQKTGEAIPFNDFTFAPGNYVAVATAVEGSNYSGETALSNVFTLFQGYEVTVGAGEYATFYKDENLYTEDEDAELYTIASVTDTEAVLSEAITVAPANTPLLVYNKSQTETLTFLLIPTTDKTPNNVTAATQFVGTLVATTIPASATGADNYALNGYAFVWVKDAIAIGANKCWLQIGDQPAAARAMTRSIVGGGDTTGIDAIENITIDNEGWYDLQGRKLQAKPNRKGIYIHNGRKVVVH